MQVIQIEVPPLLLMVRFDRSTGITHSYGKPYLSWPENHLKPKPNNELSKEVLF
jgi:hypothetical protein